jgi:hypothetical protein
MNDESIKTINYIFYLQTKSEPDNNYYLLAEILSKLSINLLPITADELKIIDRSKKNYLISIRNDFSSANYFNIIKKSFLDSAMNTGKMSLFDISSFSEIESASKHTNKNVYRYFQLPLNLKHVAIAVAVDYFRDRNLIAEWPGGKRSKLPSMVNES